MTASSTDAFRVAVAQSAGELVGFEAMTFPTYAGLLQQIGTTPTLLAVVARAGEVPAGLALTQITPETGQAVLRSVFTPAELRRRGIALALLARTEQALADRGVGRVTGTYATNSAVDVLLTRSGWDEPKLSMYLFHVGQAAAATMEQSPLFRDTVLSPGQEIVPWGSLSAEDRAASADLIDRFDIPRGLTPAAEADRLDPSLSLVLRIDGEIFGWMLIHRLTPQRVRFSGLYIRPDCPVKGLGIRLMIESLRRYIADIRERPTDDATWGCYADIPMAGFCIRRLLPHLPGTTVTQTWASGKDLLLGRMKDEG
jgi:GNAT superfamily N-acetyltransferase